MKRGYAIPLGIGDNIRCVLFGVNNLRLVVLESD